MLYYKVIKNIIGGRREVKESLSFFMDKTIKMKMGILFIYIAAMNTFVAYGALNLTVTPYEGIYLRFGEVDSTSYINREVRIRMISTEAKQYRLRQRLLQPVVNDKGEVLNEEVLNFYTVRGTNAFGSLYQDTLRLLSIRDEILYTSNSAGDSDSFIIVYSVDGRKMSQRGHFQGKILYTLESLSEGNSETYILDLSFDANPRIDVTIEIPSGENVRLDTKNESGLKSSFKIKLDAPSRSSINVYQELVEPFTDKKGKVIKDEVVKFFVSGLSKGESNYLTVSPLTRKKTLVYSSRSGGNEFYINLSVDKDLIKGVSAGMYRGKLIYYFEGDNINKVIPVNIELEVTKIFDIKVISKEGLSFFNIKPDSPPKEKVVKVEVNTNIGVPYQVIQRFSMPLTDEKGNTIADKFFRMKVELPDEDKGKTDFLDFSPVDVGDKVIFTSNTKGERATFNIIYRLDVSYDVVAGNYSTQVTYLLSEK